jgi:hypothetical protein
MKIKSIEYPNTARDCECISYIIGRNCDEIKIIQKNGEMARINWLQIIKDNEVIAEIKEGVCNLYFK